METMCINDPVEVCVKKLKSECKTFDFGLNDSFRYVSDLEICMDKLHSAYKDMKSWNKFFDQFFPTRPTSEPITRKCDMIFQAVYNMVHGGQAKTPLHTALAECIHNTCKSKLLIQIFNRLGLCTSYNDVERIDMAHTKQLIDLTGSNRVPVLETIDSESPVHGTMDNCLYLDLL